MSWLAARTLWIGATLALVVSVGPLQGSLVRPASEITAGRIHGGSPAALGKGAGDLGQLVPSSAALGAGASTGELLPALPGTFALPAPLRPALIERLGGHLTRAPPLRR